MDVVVILDASTSVTESNFQKMRNFAKDLVEKADVDSGSVRFGALIYRLVHFVNGRLLICVYTQSYYLFDTRIYICSYTILLCPFGLAAP